MVTLKTGEYVRVTYAGGSRSVYAGRVDREPDAKGFLVRLDEETGKKVEYRRFSFEKVITLVVGE